MRKFCLCTVATCLVSSSFLGVAKPQYLKRNDQLHLIIKQLQLYDVTDPSFSSTVQAKAQPAAAQLIRDKWLEMSKHCFAIMTSQKGRRVASRPMTTSQFIFLPRPVIQRTHNTTFKEAKKPTLMDVKTCTSNTLHLSCSLNRTLTSERYYFCFCFKKKCIYQRQITLRIAGDHFSS